MALKMALFVPLASILAYRKVGKAYFQLIEVRCPATAPRGSGMDRH